MATREERIQAKITAIELALSQPHIAADKTFYDKELERLQTLLQSLENPQPPPIKTALEFVSDYNYFGDVVRNFSQQAANPDTPEATRAMAEKGIETFKNLMDETAIEFATTFPNEPWTIETVPERLAIRDQLYELKDRTDSLLHLIELHQLSLERTPNPISEQLLFEHQRELETLHQRQTELQKLL